MNHIGWERGKESGRCTKYIEYKVYKGIRSIIKMISNRRDNTFPILRLPFLPIKEIFKAMDPSEIINFSMTSKRAKSLIVHHSYLFIDPRSLLSSIDCSSKMDRPKPFPILRLPFLAIEEVFKAMNPIEIINFSMINKRAKGIAKHMSFCSKYKIEFNIHATLGIRFFGTKNLVSFSYLKTSMKMDEKIEDEECGVLRKVKKYSKNSMVEWKQLCKLVFLYQRDKTINVNKHTAYLLDNIKINSELYSYVFTKNENFNAKIPKNLKELYIKNSEWIRYERLLDIDCKSVTLEKTLLTNNEWNMFLKKWIAMETNQNLEYLEIDNISLNYFTGSVLNGIPYEVVDKAVKRSLKSYCGVKTEVTGGIDIRRIDGKTGTFFYMYRPLKVNLAMSIH
ncbi:hypothetical protein GCK72_015441 [Caenorhabditis remanei]|uniref:F-box domain-containing protein n=1 Tax=Caenorhabditis remanei TaxID=31234 RepID=A0A6A5GWI2_CAERE|nr:hypothetical protein GCK72_015441 [Caenorhabditis remanei]KAF1758981.1 hypothetical protein GCK72_015441 [Caenorhabditis remanei]